VVLEGSWDENWCTYLVSRALNLRILPFTYIHVAQCWRVMVRSTCYRDALVEEVIRKCGGILCVGLLCGFIGS
jgi:hypothetical protein